MVEQVVPLRLRLNVFYNLPKMFARDLSKQNLLIFVRPEGSSRPECGLKQTTFNISIGTLKHAFTVPNDDAVLMCLREFGLPMWENVDGLLNFSQEVHGTKTI